MSIFLVFISVQWPYWPNAWFTPRIYIESILLESLWHLYWWRFHSRNFLQSAPTFCIVMCNRFTRYSYYIVYTKLFWGVTWNLAFFHTLYLVHMQCSHYVLLGIILNNSLKFLFLHEIWTWIWRRTFRLWVTTSVEIKSLVRCYILTCFFCMPLENRLNSLKSSLDFTAGDPLTFFEYLFDFLQFVRRWRYRH